jgi:ubiquinone/menaquinone biosynthesis C-methylase UbiE
VSDPGHISQFSAVDSAPDPSFAIRFMDVARTQPGLLACKAEVLDALRLRPGCSALDAGCGFGADAAEMAARVASGGAVIGIDRSEAMISAARDRHPARAGLSFQVGDVTALPFPDGSFDACRADTVLQHMRDPEAALAEMVRVVGPGGRVAGCELDLETQTVDSPYRAVTRAIVTSAADSLANGWAGRQLSRLYREAGLTDVTAAPRAFLCNFQMVRFALGSHVDRLRTSGALDPEVAERWWADLRHAEDAGRFLSCLTAFVVAGTKA